MNALLDFFSHEAGQARRNWLDGQMNRLGEAARYYAGPYAPSLLPLAEVNPVQDVGNAMAAGRDGDYVGMVNNTAMAVAPVVAGKLAKTINPKMADDAVQWLEDALMGFSVNPTRAAVTDMGQRFVADEDGSVALLGGGRSDPTKTGWTFKDVNGNIGLSKAENRLLSEGAKMPRTEIVPIRSLYAMQSHVNPDFATTETSAGMLPNVVRKNGKLFLQDGHHRATKVAEEGGQNVRVNFFDFDNVDTSTPLLDYDIDRAAKEWAEVDALFAELFNDTPQLTPAQEQAQDVLDLLSAGRADEVTDDMLAKADDLYLFENYDLPMDEASRMARADGGWPDDAYHATKRDFDRFKPSNFRGASFFGPTPEGATKGASASANEGVGSGNGIIIPARVDTSGVEGLGSYARKDMNDFRASLDDRVYSEAEVDALMASDSAPLRGDWTYFFDDVTDYDALRAFMESKPGEPIPDGIIGYKPAEPLRYSGELRRDNTGRQFAHYSDGMSEKPTSDYVTSQGNTGFTMQDESGLALAITDPTTVRSRFARFDPRLKHLSNLSAAAAGGAITLNQMTQQEREQEVIDYLEGAL